MPQIPVFNQQQVNASREGQSYSNVKVDPNAFGVTGYSDLGKGLIYTSKTLQEKQEEIDKTLVSESVNKLAQYQLDSLHNPETGYLTKTGKAAIGVESNLEKDFEKLGEELKGSLKSSAAQKAFQDIFDKTKLGYMQTIYRHSDNQTKVYQADVMKEGIYTQTQLAVANRNDPEKLAVNIANINAFYEANSKEVDPELRKFEKAQLISDAHRAVIDAKLAEGSLDAKDYFEKNKESIDPLVQPKYLAAIKENTLKGKSQFEADRIRSLGLSFDKQLAEVRKIKDPELRDATQARVEHDYALNERIKQQNYDNNLESAWTRFEQNPNLNNIPSWLDHNDRMAMRSYAKQVAEGGQVKTDQEVWYGLYEMAINEPDKFSKLNLMQYKASLSDSDFQEIAKLKKSAGTPEYTQIITPLQEVKNVAAALGLDDKKHSEKVSELQYIVQNAIQAEEQARGRKFTAPERTDFIKSFEYKANHPGRDYDSTLDIYRRGLENNANFLRETINDFKYFEKVHGRPPDAKERNDITYMRASKVIQKQNIDTAKGIDTTRTPQLKSYASYIPMLNKKLGTSFQITSGYRKGDPQTHGKGLAVDVGMTGKHKTEKIAFFKSELNNPKVARIGTSDPEVIAVFKNHPKLKDERAYDKKNGTNHVNHAHITLAVNTSREVEMTDAKGNKALVLVDDRGNPIRVIREL